MFPFLDPDWADKYRWMSFDTRCALGIFAFIWDAIVILGTIGGLIVLLANGHWVIAVSIISVIGLYFLIRFIRTIYLEYRQEYPKRTIPITEKKKRFFNFSS